MYCSFGDFINVNSPSTLGVRVLTGSVTALAAGCRRNFIFFFYFHFTLVIYFNVDTKWLRLWVGFIFRKELVF